ncbi:MAG TPA: hypothetical protein VGC99_00200 [Candidatus Tectomicrobia bacterium]
MPLPLLLPLAIGDDLEHLGIALLLEALPSDGSVANFYLGLISENQMSKNQQLTASKKLTNRNLRHICHEYGNGRMRDE